MKFLRIVFCVSLLSQLVSCEESREFVEVNPVDSLKQTAFVSTIEKEVDFSKNQIYCMTLAYAWDQLKSEIGKPTKVLDNEELQLLDQSEGFKNTLLENELETETLITDSLIKVKVSFFKQLPFEVPFIRNKGHLNFKGQPIESFGAAGYNTEEVKQLEILFYKDENNNALKLIPEDKNHEIILYQSENDGARSLKDKYLSCKKKSDAFLKEKKNAEGSRWKYSFEEEDRFSAPVFNFNLFKEYKDIEGAKVQHGEQVYVIEKATQRTALILDEKGAKIESVVEFATEAVEEIEVKPVPKYFIYNKPFLLAFKRVDAEFPYLLVWVQNPEILVARKKAEE